MSPKSIELVLRNDKIVLFSMFLHIIILTLDQILNPEQAQG